MTHCPACQHAFDEPGFCPFDGTPLVEDGARRGEYDHLIGTTLDERYRVVRKLGEGGMGVVFAVSHTVIERPLAIKVLKRRVMRDAATIQRFVQEAKAASRIGHPNIVDVTDFGKTPDGLTYSVMEYVEGTTLAQLNDEGGPLPAERAVNIAAQIARALAAAHAKGIVHRDLKPENVFLTARDGWPDFVKIVDFGIAKVAPAEGSPEGPRLTKAGAVFGTPKYMAPEQAAGRSDIDHRVDVYALGVILYEMLVGKVPLVGANSLQTIAMKLTDTIVPLRRVRAEVPSALDTIAMKALERERDSRYATMSELLVALEQFAQTPPVDDEEPPPRPRRTKPSRVPMILASIAVLLLGAGISVVVLRPRGAPLVIPDAPRIAEVVVAPADAALVEIQVDAAPVDAAPVAELRRDAGVRVVAPTPRDAAVERTAPIDRNRIVTIEIMTRPGDAQVFVGKTFRGPGGVQLSERVGTTLKIECMTERMKGSVEVVFDGSLTAVMCTASRDRYCVPGLKNPYDDCEEDPNAE